ncbi:MAG: nucleotide pyrophosphohydrolase [Erysipelotrichales bacterium]
MEKARKEILKMQKERNWKQFHTPVNIAKSISIEAGELLECFQWNNDDFNKEDVVDELADIVNYAILMADTLDVDLETIVLNKIEKNKEKYPIEKSWNNSKKYTEFNREK